jgi:hypothetical protein
VTIAIRRTTGGSAAPTRTRAVRLSLAAAAAGLVLAGCASGPAQAGSAAIVGNTAIPLSTVQQELDAAVSSQAAVKQAQAQGQLDQVSREILTEQVMHKVTAAAAGQYRLAVTDAQLDKYISASGGIDKLTSPDLSAADRRSTARDQLIEAEYATGFVDSLAVNFDYFQAQTQADALSEAKQVAATPGMFQTIASSVASQGGDANMGLSVKLSQYVANPQSSDLAPLFGAKPNTVIVFSPNLGQAQSQPVWYVMRINSRTGATRTATPSAAAGTASTPVLATVGASLLRPVADSLDVRISPRYGVWDSASLEVAPAAQEGSVAEFPASPAAKK